jgi:hypothetical protein
VSELGRAVAIAYDPSSVQMHTYADVTSEVAARMAWLGVAVAAFPWSAPAGFFATAGFGLYLGGALANLVELRFAGGVADYLPAGGYVFSIGDVAVALGCLFMYPPLVAAGVSWWTRRRNPAMTTLRRAGARVITVADRRLRATAYARYR